MRKATGWVICLGWVIFLVINPTGLASAAIQEEAQEKSDEPSEPPPPPPRVLGQAATQQELDEWRAVERAFSADEKISLAKTFLQNYPNSGLSAYAHRALSLGHYQNNDEVEFVHHGEKALEELPGDVAVLAMLAWFYSENEQSDKAIDRAQRALHFIDLTQRPGFVSVSDWSERSDRIKADAHYAQGRAYMEKFDASGAEEASQEDPNLQASADHFRKAVILVPDFGQAYHRLGYVYVKQQQIEPAISSYLRAVAIPGPASQPARVDLEAVLVQMGRSPDTIDEMVSRETQYIEEKKAEKIALRQKLEAEAAAAAPPSPVVQ